MRVSRRGSDTFLDGAGQAGSTWAARLNEGGEYLVEVVRRAPYCEPPVISHLLTLSLTPLDGAGSGSVGVDVWGSRGRRRVSGVGRWVMWTARGIAVHGQGFAKRRWTQIPGT